MQLKSIFTIFKGLPHLDKKLNGERIIKGLLFFTLFSLPLFFDLGGINNLDLSKQTLLIYISFLVLILWISTAILQGTFRFRFSLLHPIAFVFILLMALSTIFSRWRWGSLWGWPLDTGASFLTFLACFVFYLLIANVFDKKDALGGQVFLIVSGAFVALIGILQFFGKFLLPGDFTKTTSFNTIGTINGLAIFLASLFSPLFVLFMLSCQKRKGNRRLGVPLFLAAGIILTGFVLSNYWLGWLGVLVSMSVLLVFGLWGLERNHFVFLMIPVILFALALLFGVLRVQAPILITMPQEALPSWQATFQVSKEMIRGSTKDLLLGQGPGTFKYGWSSFKHPDLNQTIFWNIRFSKGGAQISEMLGPVGILPLIVYLGLMTLAILLGSKQALLLAKDKKSLDWFLLVGILASFIMLSVVKFLYPANLTLEWMWWFLLANIGIFVGQEVKTINLSVSPRASLLLSVVGICSLVAGVLLFYLQGTRVLAEAKYNRVRLTTQNLQEIGALLSQALSLNPQQELFWQSLSSVYLAQANQEISRTDVSDEEKMQRVGDFIVRAMNAGKRASEINPENAANWQTRAMIHQEIIGLVRKKAFEEAVNSYQRVLALEPSNPFVLVQLGRTYLAQASLVTDEKERDNLLEKSQEYFKKAVELKPDYAPAFYQMALVYDAQGKRQEAISTLEGIKIMSPFMTTYNPLQDIGLAFQLGLLYYGDEKLPQAQAEFERAIGLDPDYSNARYFLGLVYDKEGQKDKAIEQFEQIERLNPDNVEVKKVLTNLKEGKPGLEGVAISPQTVPIEQGP